MNSYEKNEINPQFIFLEKIKALFITIIEKERINNALKISLANYPNKNIQNFFYSIDTSKKNYLDLNDLKHFFDFNSISYNEQIIRRFIRLFDKHNNFYLIYEDFLKIFFPYEKKEINNELNKINLKEKEIELSILNNYLELIEQINEIIIDIKNTKNFTTYEAFMGITKGNKYLDEEFLIHFLEHNYTSEEIKNLMYLFDKDNDCLISYEEFQDIFIPLIQGNNISNEEIEIDSDKNKINIENNNDIVNYEKSGKCPNKIKNNILNNKDNINNDENESKEEINNNNKNKNDNYELNFNSDDYDNYCKFYLKTKQILSSPSKKNDNDKIKKNKNSEKKITNNDITLSEKINEDKNDININSDSKENDLNNNNINNFTCGNINSNDLENYSLSNDCNINNNNNILSSDTLSKENKSISNFIKYIQLILSKEKHTMELKDNLCLREDLSLKNIFCIFDYNKKNKISKKEFKVVCKKIFGLYPTSDQVNLVYKRYDKDKDNNLNLKEFLNMIKPLKEEYACFLFNKDNKDNNNNDNINMKSKKILTDVIRTIIEDEGNYYKYKYDLENKDLFKLNEFWEEIKKYLNEKGFDKIAMNKFLNDFGCNLNQYDIDIIFNKIDYDHDDIISYNDLTQEFLYYY